MLLVMKLYSYLLNNNCEKTIDKFIIKIYTTI